MLIFIFGLCSLVKKNKYKVSKYETFFLGKNSYVVVLIWQGQTKATNS